MTDAASTSLAGEHPLLGGRAVVQSMIYGADRPEGVG